MTATVDAAPVVLRLERLAKAFGAVRAVDDVSLELRRGEVLALLGENGAGKTTLMNLLFGHYLPDAGEVRVRDRGGTLRSLPLGVPRAALDAGVGMVHQHFTLARNLTALDNILLGTEPLLAWRRQRGGRAKVERLMAESGLRTSLDTRVERLSVGERQRVEILKALHRDAHVLILDEPTAVLTPQEAAGLFATLKRLAARGLAVVFISHKLNEVLAFADRIAVLRAGRKVAELPAAGATPAHLAAVMVGRDAQPLRRPPPRLPGAPVLELDGVTVPGRSGWRRLAAATFAIHAGEIVGLAGVSGNGQAALAALLSGLVAPTRGQVRLGGRRLRRYTPQAFVGGGVGRIPEDRHHDGVVGALSLAENLVLERLDDAAVSRLGFLRRGAIHDDAERLIDAYDVRAAGPTAPARLLSGGNIQKLILARVLDRRPQLIIANQPTRGLDVGATGDVGRRLLEARERGAGVLLISEDLDEILALADRVLVIHDGSVVDAGPAETLDLASLGLLMMGQAA